MYLSIKSMSFCSFEKLSFDNFYNSYTQFWNYDSIWLILSVVEPFEVCVELIDWDEDFKWSTVLPKICADFLLRVRPELVLVENPNLLQLFNSLQFLLIGLMENDWLTSVKGFLIISSRVRKFGFERIEGMRYGLEHD